MNSLGSRYQEISKVLKKVDPKLGKNLHEQRFIDALLLVSDLYLRNQNRDPLSVLEPNAEFTGMACDTVFSHNGGQRTITYQTKHLLTGYVFCHYSQFEQEKFERDMNAAKKLWNSQIEIHDDPNIGQNKNFLGDASIIVQADQNQTIFSNNNNNQNWITSASADHHNFIDIDSHDHSKFQNDTTITTDFNQNYSKSILNFQNVIPVISKNYLVKIVAVHDPPFSVWNESNDTFTGIGPEILEMMRNQSKNELGYEFNYMIKKVDEFGKNTSCALPECWSGAVGYVANNKVDLAIGAITKTDLRRDVVRFTHPFKKTSFAIMIHRSSKLDNQFKDETIHPWSFIKPFCSELWSLILVAVFLVSSIMFFIDRISPYGHHGQYFQRNRLPQTTLLDKNSAKLEEKARSEALSLMSLSNSFYWSWTGLCWQSPESVPRSPSGRIIAIIWYMCGVIFITSYTANLVAFLTYQNNKIERIQTFQELEQQLDSHYVGTLKNSVAHEFLETSFPKIYDHAVTSRTAFTNFNDLWKSIKKRTDKPYAVIWEADSLDRWITTLNADPDFNHFYIPEKSRYGRNEFCFITQHKSKVGDAFIRWMKNLAHKNAFYEIDNLHLERNETAEKTNTEYQQKLDGNGSLEVQHLGGVFTILKSMPTLCILVLCLEWMIASTKDVDNYDPNAPHSISEAFETRFARMQLDLLNQEEASIGHYLHKLFPGRMATQEFKAQMVLRKAGKRRATRRKALLKSSIVYNKNTDLYREGDDLRKSQIGRASQITRTSAFQNNLSRSVSVTDVNLCKKEQPNSAIRKNSSYLVSKQYSNLNHHDLEKDFDQKYNFSSENKPQGLMIWKRTSTNSYSSKNSISNTSLPKTVQTVSANSKRNLTRRRAFSGNLQLENKPSDEEIYLEQEKEIVPYRRARNNHLFDSTTLRNSNMTDIPENSNSFGSPNSSPIRNNSRRHSDATAMTGIFSSITNKKQRPSIINYKNNHEFLDDTTNELTNLYLPSFDDIDQINKIGLEATMTWSEDTDGIMRQKFDPKKAVHYYNLNLMNIKKKRNGKYHSYNQKIDNFRDIALRDLDNGNDDFYGPRFYESDLRETYIEMNSDTEERIIVKYSDLEFWGE